MKAETEVKQQMERLGSDLESRFEFLVHQRVEAQLLSRVDTEVMQKMIELNLVPAHSLSLHSTHSSSTSSQLSAETGITSMSSSFQSPARHSVSQLSAPDSPADIDMYSPSRDESPFKRDNVFDKPSVPQVLHLKPPLEHRLSDPNPLGNTSMQDLGVELEGDSDDGYDGDDSKPQNTPQQLGRVAPTGSPMKRAGNGQIRRTQTTTGVNLSSSSRTTPTLDELGMANAATVKSSTQKENQSWEEKLTQPREARQEVKLQESVPATWDPKTDEMPSPFLKKRKL